MFKDNYSVRTHLTKLFMQRYERYLPTAFDESMSILEKMNKLIEAQNSLIDVVNSHTEFTSKQLERAFGIIDDNLAKQLKQFRDELEEQKIQYEEIRDKIHSDLLPDSVKQKLEEWLLNGTIEELINEVVFSDFNEKLEYLENYSQSMETLAVNVDIFMNPQEAMQYAYENNYNLNWGNKHHVLTGNLPNFNDIKHLGNGSIEVDGETFHLNPGYNDVNTLFVRTDGDNSNMGVSPQKAFKTIQKAVDILRHRDETLGGRWIIDIGEGTFGGAYINNLESQRQLTITGKVDAETNQPTTIVSGTLNGGTGGRFGLRVEPAMKDLLVENIMFSKFQGTSTSYGFLMKTGGKSTLRNCRAYDCTLGFACVNSGVIITSSCIAKRCDTGYTVSYGSTATFGGSGLFGDGTGSQALECATGASITRNAVAHVDYMEVEDCTYAGVDVNMSSRVHVLGSHFKRNKIGVDASGASEWINNDSIPNYFYEATADENEVNYGHFGVARETRLYSQRSGNDFRTFVALPNHVTTGNTVTNNAVITNSGYYLPKYFLRYSGKKVKVVVSGRYTGNGQKTVQVVLQNVTDSGGTGSGLDVLDSFDYPNDSTVRPFRFEVELDSSGDNSGVVTGQRMVHLGTYPYAISKQISISDTSLRKQLRIRTQLSDVGDKIYIDKVELYVMG